MLLPPLLRRTRTLAALALVALVGAGCTADLSDGSVDATVGSTGSALGDEAVTIGAFNFDESVLLAELYGQGLEAAGFQVERRLDIGPREVVLPALELGMLELVPEYAGAALEYYSDRLASGLDTEGTHARLVEALAPIGLHALAAAPAEDRDALAVTRATAEQHDLQRVSDLHDLGARFVLGAPPECPLRPTCLPGLERVYDLRFEDFVPLDVGGPVTAQALSEGVVDVAQVFTTDADVLLNDFVVLDDDRDLQPAQNVVPVIRPELVDRFGPELVERIDAVSRRLTTREVAVMDELIERGRSPSAVAAEWIAREGLSEDPAG